MWRRSWGFERSFSVPVAVGFGSSSSSQRSAPKPWPIPCGHAGSSHRMFSTPQTAAERTAPPSTRKTTSFVSESIKLGAWALRFYWIGVLSPTDCTTSVHSSAGVGSTLPEPSSIWRRIDSSVASIPSSNGSLSPPVSSSSSTERGPKLR